MGRKESKPRYRVEIVGWTSHESRLRGGFARHFEINVSHAFTSRVKAERFAESISHYLPERVPGEVTDAWVLVYALPSRGDAEIRTAAGVVWSRDEGICYLSFDPGGIVNKRHPIPAGYFGHDADRPSITSKIEPRKPIRIDVRHNFGGKECSFATLAEIEHPSHGRVTLDRTRENTVTTYYVRFHSDGINCNGASVCRSYAHALETFASVAGTAGAS